MCNLANLILGREENRNWMNGKRTHKPKSKYFNSQYSITLNLINEDETEINSISKQCDREESTYFFLQPQQKVRSALTTVGDCSKMF